MLLERGIVVSYDNNTTMGPNRQPVSARCNEMTSRAEPRHDGFAVEHASAAFVLGRTPKMSRLAVADSQTPAAP